MTVPYLGLGRAQETQCTLTSVVPQGLHCCPLKSGPCRLISRPVASSNVSPEMRSQQSSVDDHASNQNGSEHFDLPQKMPTKLTSKLRDLRHNIASKTTHSPHPQRRRLGLRSPASPSSCGSQIFSTSSHLRFGSHCSRQHLGRYWGTIQKRCNSPRYSEKNRRGHERAEGKGKGRGYR
jgi:hypothetical protein